MAKKSNTLNDLTKFLEFENIQFSGGTVMKSEDEFLTKTPVSFVNITSKETDKETQATEKKQTKKVQTEQKTTVDVSIEDTVKDLYLSAIQPFDHFGILKFTVEYQTSVFSSWMDFQRKLWLIK